MARASAMRPGSGGGPIQNAKAQSTVRQVYTKGAGGKAAAKVPPKKPGQHNDSGRPRKPSPFGKKK